MARQDSFRLHCTKCPCCHAPSHEKWHKCNMGSAESLLPVSPSNWKWETSFLNREGTLCEKRRMCLSSWILKAEWGEEGFQIAASQEQIKSVEIANYTTTPENVKVMRCTGPLSYQMIANELHDHVKRRTIRLAKVKEMKALAYRNAHPMQRGKFDPVHNAELIAAEKLNKDSGNGISVKKRRNKLNKTPRDKKQTKVPKKPRKSSASTELQSRGHKASSKTKRTKLDYGSGTQKK